MKCLQYWPENIGEVKIIGKFEVSLKAKDMFSDFSMNQIEVLHVSENLLTTNNIATLNYVLDVVH